MIVGKATKIDTVVKLGVGHRDRVDTAQVRQMTDSSRVVEAQPMVTLIDVVNVAQITLEVEMDLRLVDFAEVECLMLDCTHYAHRTIVETSFEIACKPQFESGWFSLKKHAGHFSQRVTVLGRLNSANI